MFEDEAPKPLSGYRVGENLDAWSVGDLTELVKKLQDEIVRVQAEIGRKRGDLSAAEALFKT